MTSIWAANPDPNPGINTLFRLSCGCVLDGCHDSHPAWHFAEDGPGTGSLFCTVHRRWEPLDAFVSLAPLPEPADRQRSR
jgi:hypothetical protein